MLFCEYILQNKGGFNLKKSNVFLFVFSAFFCVLLIMFPQYAAVSGKNALKMCAESLIPSLFPFMVLGNLLVSCGGGEVLGRWLSVPMKRIFGLGGACSLPVVVGLISGFPVGATVTAELVKSGEISRDEGERVLCLCNNPGPVFVLSTVSGMLGCGRAGGLVLWLSVTLSAIVSGLLFGRGAPSPRRAVVPTYENGAGCVVSSVKKSVVSMLNVCGFITFFGVIVNIVSAGSGKLTGVLAGGILETATGCFKLSLWNISEKLPIAAMILSWSGLSVHAQVAAAVDGSGISLGRYIRAKLVQAVASLRLLFLCGHLRWLLCFSVW